MRSASAPKPGKNRLYLELAPLDEAGPHAEVDRLATLGATRVDIGQGDVDRVVGDTTVDAGNASDGELVSEQIDFYRADADQAIPGPTRASGRARCYRR